MFPIRKRIVLLHLGGNVIRTTADYSFYVHGQGWTDAADLLLNYHLFEVELRPLLEDALTRRSSTRLIALIRDSLASLRDPDEGTPLGADWRRKVDIADVQQCGEIALTKYYSPKNVGLSYEWQDINDMI